MFPLFSDLLKKNLSRIVNVSSIVAQLRGVNFSELKKSTGTFNQYVISKLCQILFTVELASRLEGSSVSTYSLHPGLANTEAYRNVRKWFQRLVLLFIKIFLKVRYICLKATFSLLNLNFVNYLPK